MTRGDSAPDRWSPSGQIMAWAVVAELVLAIVAIVYPEFHRPRVLVVATAMAIGSAVLTARAHMPAQAKAGLISLLCLALLGLATVHDPFGLRAIDQSFEDATRPTDGVIDPSDTPSTLTLAPATTQVTLKAKGDADATVFADDLARSVALKSGPHSGRYHIDGLIEVTAGVAGNTYRLTWSVGRYAEGLWCGRIVAVGQARDAVLDSFSMTLAAALKRARDGTMSCS